ncbi:unnamed protein product, partial [marine sediment metagenome]
MTDIVLIQIPPWGVNTPPLGIAYLSSYLKGKGFHVEVLDINEALYNMVADKSLWDFERKDEWSDDESFNKIKDILGRGITYCVEKILSIDPMIVGLSINQNSALFSLEIAKRIKQTENKLVISGGWGCYNKHERDLLRREDLIDAFVIGEGEESLYELISSFKSRGKIEGIKGVLAKREDDMSFSPRPLIENLDEVPFPTYKEFELTNYTPALRMLSSRGCMG